MISTVIVITLSIISFILGARYGASIQSTKDKVVLSTMESTVAKISEQHKANFNRIKELEELNKNIRCDISNFIKKNQG